MRWLISKEDGGKIQRNVGHALAGKVKVSS